MSEMKRYVATMITQFEVRTDYDDLGELKRRLLEHQKYHIVSSVGDFGGYSWDKEKAKRSVTLHEIKPKKRNKKV